MRNMSLFADNTAWIATRSHRKEPAVWIRRLQLLEALESDKESIRRVDFRRGLNIICTAKAQSHERDVVGHSVGKTMLMRLIRYCLGEHTFCTKAVRGAVADVLKDAYVLAEFCVNGKPWLVARPIGLDASRTSSWAMQGENLDALRSGPKGMAKFRDFVGEFEKMVEEPFSGVPLPHAERKAAWLDLLAWLSRDQDCSYRRRNEWRDPQSESGTAQLELQDASLIMRMAMGLLGDDEKKLQVPHQRLLADKRQLTKDIERLKAQLDGEAEELKKVVKTDKDIGAGPLFGQIAGDAAREKIKQLRGLLMDEEANTKHKVFDRKREELIEVVARLEQHRTETEGTLKAEEALQHQLEEADANTYYATFADVGARWCRQFQTEEEARAGGCPAKPSLLKPGEKDPAQAKRIRDCQQHVKALKGELADLASRLAAKADERDKARKQYQKALDDHLKAIGGMRQSIGAWEEIEKRARRYGEFWEELTSKEAALKKLEKRIDLSGKQQQKARSLLKDKQAELSWCFDHVLKRLISPKAGGKVVLDAYGIVPRPSRTVAASGQALSTSATVLGLDLACLVGYARGLGHLPGIFLHDSPREADMEDALYHRLFYLMADLESAFGSDEPSFQYIVATTTPPPQELDCEPYVRLRLDARKDEGLLLGRRFTVE